MAATPLLDSRPWRLWVVPHTHWDREWYLPLEDFRIRLAQVVDELIETLEARPDDPGPRALGRDERLRPCFTLDGQAIVIEDYLEIRPEMEERLRALLASGRVETGPCYVLPDEFLVGGESLIRNLLHGRAVCQRYGAAPAPVGYLPDSFGHPAQLPQLLRGFGLETFVFSRGLGDERERVGARFRWRAPDGSEVLALPQPVDYAAAASLGHSRLSAETDAARNAADRIEQVLRAEEPMLADPGFRDLFLGSGYDHSALQADLPEVLAALGSLKPGLEPRLARVSEYAAAMAADGDERVAGLPMFEGELVGGARANVLRGVNSTRMLGKGLPEYETTEEGELALTLLRCVGWMSRDDLSTRRGGAGPQLPVPGAQCHGEHLFEYALELGEPADAELLRRSQDYRFDFVEGAPGVELRPPLDGLDGDLVFSALKAAEDGDGAVLRVFAAGGAETPRLPPGSTRTRLDETTISPSRRVAAGEIASFRLRPVAR